MELVILQCHSFSPSSFKFSPAARTELIAISKTAKFQMNCQRRSANYHPTVWEHDMIESFSTAYTYDVYGTKLEKLKQEGRELLKSSREPSSLIDLMQRLGVAYHFEVEIKEAMDLVGSSFNSCCSNLYTTSLQFRLLREHGHGTSTEINKTDVFNKFKDRDGKWLESLGKDVNGLLSLYEALFHGIHGEDYFEEAERFIVHQLESSSEKMDMKLAAEVQKALQLPLYWRMKRLEARDFIVHLSNLGGNEKELVLLELAMLDYNLVQSQYQKEVKELSKWWTNLGFKEKLSFSRDRLLENYLWALGFIFEPQFSKCRADLTKYICIFSAIDDMYDIYGSLDELERFTDAVKRWDISALDDLPEYMKICYLAMLNFGNAMVYDVLRDHDLNIVSNVKEVWGNLCSSYLVEARWFGRGYTPTLEEYLETAWISVGGLAALTLASLSLVGASMYKTDLKGFKNSEVIYWSLIILRLSDDLGTSKHEILRGDVAKSIQCYMFHEGVSEEEARDHIKGLISIAWRKLNGAISVNESVPKPIVKMSVNMARTAMCMFQHGDGIGTSSGLTKEHLTSLIAEPLDI